MESTYKYIVPLVGGPYDGAVLCLTMAPTPNLLIARNATAEFQPVVPGEFLAIPPHKYLLQPSPARYIYEHLARPQTI